MGGTESTKDHSRARMFEDGNRIKFARPVDQSARAWWVERFYDPFVLTPENIGDLITKSAAGDKNIFYEFIDGVGQTFRLRVEGALSGPGEVWFVERTFELRGNLFNADEMFVAETIRAGASWATSSTQANCCTSIESRFRRKTSGGMSGSEWAFDRTRARGSTCARP